MKARKDPLSSDPFNLRSKLRVVPDWPRKGVNFIDITTLLKEPEAFKHAIDELTSHFSGRSIDLVVGIEARGLIIGSPIAYKLGTGFIPARKKGRLPADKLSKNYTLEYSSESLEMHVDAIQPGQKVVIIDDLLATGGTAQATAELIEKIGGIVVGMGFLVELDFLKGREKLRGYDLISLVHFEE